MKPIFRYWFPGTADIAAVMDFKERVHQLSDDELAAFYKTLRCRAKARATDASEESLQWVLRRMARESRSLLDVGCGNGYWLRRCAALGKDTSGCDLFETPETGALGTMRIPFRVGNVEHLPFPDKSFDVVTCFHVLEHARRLDQAIAELKRVAKQQLLLIVPCQRYFRYTLDLHIHFFYSPSYFRSVIGLHDSEAARVGGDIAYAARIGHEESQGNGSRASVELRGEKQ